MTALTLFDTDEFEMPRVGKLTDLPEPGVVRAEQRGNDLILVAIDVIMWAKDEDYETARKSWNNAKQTTFGQGNFFLVQLKARALDGKMREADALSRDQLYRLAFDLPGKKTARFKDAAAYILAELDRQAARYGQSIMDYVKGGRAFVWARTRVDAKLAQSTFNEALRTYHIARTPDYMRVALAQIYGLFGLSKQRIIVEMELTDAQAKHFRDHLSEWAQRAITDACEMAERQMAALNRALTDKEQIALVQRVSEVAGRAMREYARLMNVDYLSGAPLDASGKPLRDTQLKLIKGGAK